MRKPVIAGAATLAAIAGLATAGGSAGLAGCASPVEDDLIESLGPEAEGESEGEFHRYGQPCLVCHGGYGPGSPTFSFGGTVFARPNDEVPVAGAEVTITDSVGEKTTMTSNCAGNFYVEDAKFSPVYPVRVEVACTPPPGFDGIQRTYRNLMGTRVNRDGACASCHDNAPPSQTGPGRIYCTEQGISSAYVVDPECRGGPKDGAGTGAVGASSSVGASSGGGP